MLLGWQQWRPVKFSVGRPASVFSFLGFQSIVHEQFVFALLLMNYPLFCDDRRSMLVFLLSPLMHVDHGIEGICAASFDGNHSKG